VCIDKKMAGSWTARVISSPVFLKKIRLRAGAGAGGGGGGETTCCSHCHHTMQSRGCPVPGLQMQCHVMQRGRMRKRLVFCDMVTMVCGVRGSRDGMGAGEQQRQQQGGDDLPTLCGMGRDESPSIDGNSLLQGANVMVWLCSRWWVWCLACVLPVKATAAGEPGYTPSPMEIPPWEIWIGFIAGVVPFVVASYEFGKRIVLQRRCEQCNGRGLVHKGKYWKKCAKVWGLSPLNVSPQSWCRVLL